MSLHTHRHDTPAQHVANKHSHPPPRAPRAHLNTRSPFESLRTSSLPFDHPEISSGVPSASRSNDEMHVTCDVAGPRQ